MILWKWKSCLKILIRSGTKAINIKKWKTLTTYIKKDDRKPLESYAISRAEPNTKLSSKIMPIIPKDLSLGAFWVQPFLGVIYY